MSFPRSQSYEQLDRPSGTNNLTTLKSFSTRLEPLPSKPSAAHVV